MAFHRESFQDSSERSRLLKDDNEGQDVKIDTLSKSREIAIVAVTLLIQFFALSSDSVIYSFFPIVSKEKGLTYTEIGIVFSSYGFTRCIASPICGSLVRNVT